MKIYRNGIEIYDLTIDNKTQLSQKLMGRDLITMNVTVDSKLDIQVNDYITHNGVTYTVNRPVSETKISEVEYRYTVQFEGPYYQLLDKIVMLNGKAEFYLTGYLTDFVDLIVSNINEIHTGWTKGTVVASDWKNVYFSGKTCKEALEQLATDFSVEFSIVGKTINLVERVENATLLTFQHGKGNGLYELSRENVDDGNTVTRVHAFGSKRNIPYDYRGGAGRLVFQNLDGTRYLENTSEYSRIIEKVVVFENIWPRFEGAVSTVSTDKLTITCPAIDFDLNDQLLAGITAKVVFLDGDLMGNQFEVSAYDHATKSITLIQGASEGGLVMPKADTFYANPGDKFVFVDILMPQSYIDTAEASLKAAAQAYLDYYSRLRVKYKLSLDYRYIRDNAITLKVGDVIRVIDADLGIDKQIRITGISANLDNSGIEADISNFIEERFQKQVTSQLNDTLASIASLESAVEKQNITTNVYKGSRIWGGNEAKRINDLALQSGLDGTYFIEVDRSGLTESKKASTGDFWLKSGLVQSGNYLLLGGVTKVAAGDSDKLGGIVAANYYHTGNANRSDVNWAMNNGTITGYATSPTYTSGFAGSGWRIDPADNRLTVDNLTVRKEMSVYELVINKIRGTNGALWVSDAAKVSGVSGSRLTIDTGGSVTLVPFVLNDLVRCQRWTGSNVKYYVARVTAVGSNYIDVTKTDGTSAFEVGDEIVRIGNTTNTDRQGAIYLTASDGNSPYIDVLNGVVSADLAGKTKVRLGKLDGITDAQFGPLTGYGLYGENVYLKGAIYVTGGNAETTTGAQSKADAAQSAAVSTAASDATTKVTSLQNISLVNRGAVPLVDWNTITTIGIYSVTNASQSMANFPSGAYPYGQLRVETIGNIVTQTFTTHSGTQIHTRSKYNASDWIPWRQIEDITGSQTKANAAQSSAQTYAAGLISALSGSLGDMAYQDLVNIAKLDSTIIQGGYIKTTLLDVSAIKVTGGLASQVEAQGYASTAQTNAISTAATDATTKANNAQSTAISTASVDATTKANNAQSGAQSYADGLYDTLNDAKQEAIVNGQTLIVGGYLNTNFIEAGSIVAEKIVFDGATGNNVNLSGTINAANGTIGGFSISSSGIVNDTGLAYVICRNTTEGRDARIGSSVFPLAGSGVTYFKNEYYNPYATNYAVYARARNTGSQYPGDKGYYAGYFDGHVEVANGDLNVSGLVRGRLALPLSTRKNNMPDVNNYYLSSNYNIFIGDLKTTNRNYYLPSAASYQDGEMIYFSNWNDHDAYLHALSGQTINGYTDAQKYISLTSAVHSCVLMSNGSNQWIIVSCYGTF
ncbi:MAG: phage tail protein [Mangrovibacterium sp.]